MNPIELPFRATTAQACAWLEQQTGTPWTLAGMLDMELTPYVWLDYDPAFPDLFGDANGGYAAPIFFRDDIARLATGSADVLITRTKDVHQLVAELPAPGFARSLDALRFQRKDLERLAARLKRESQAVPVQPEPARESRNGIARDQVLAAFGGMVRIDLERALTEAGGIFGDEGARVKGSGKTGSGKNKGKQSALWNPVTLALGLNEVHRVPLSQLKRAFQTQPFLFDWAPQWNETLALLGK